MTEQTYELQEHDQEFFKDLRKAVIKHVNSAMQKGSSTKFQLLTANAQVVILSEMIGHIIGAITQDGSYHLKVAEQVKNNIIDTATGADNEK